MTTIVCDASLIAAILLPDEWTERVPEVAAMLSGAELWVPAHFPIEIGSLLTTAERRGRIDREERLRCLIEAQRANARIDDVSTLPSAAITDLALNASLSVYDAAYLELASRRRAVLASNDARLLTAAVERGVATLSTRPLRA